MQTERLSNRMPRKRKSVSLDEGLLKAAEERARRLQYKDFSAYLDYLLEKDLEERPPHTILREEPEEFRLKRGCEEEKDGS